MNIFIYGTKKAETPSKLINHLKNSFTGYTKEGLPQGEHFTINYGRTNIIADLNKKVYSDKIKAFELMKTQGLNVPKVYNLYDWKRLQYPLLARKKKHSRGSDIIYLRSKRSLIKRYKRVMKRDVLVEYIPKESEYRVHVLGNEVAGVYQKVHSDKTTIHHEHIWCKDKGWTLVEYQGDKRQTLGELGIKAVKALNYDFGAVDIGLGKNGQYYIFEVNSAPRLTVVRRRLYAKFFRHKEKEFRNKMKEAK